MSRVSLFDRLQYHGARLTARLPERLQQLLAGEPPLIADGLRFDTHAQLLRNIRRRRHRYGLLEPDIATARRRYRYETHVFRGPVTEVGSVRDFDIDGLRVRHYAPSSESRELTVYLHGGGFVIGDLETHDEPCRILAAHANVHVLSVDYRLAPEHPFPAALDDVRQALHWARQNFASVSIGGDSAGANLATVVARELQPRAQLLIYPVTDVVRDRPSIALFGEGHFLTMADREGFRRCYLDGTNARDDDPRISPLCARDFSHQPPALVVTAGFDLLRDEGEAYADALRAAGNIVRTMRIDAHGHGFIHLTGINRTARAAMIGIATEWRTLLDGVAT